MTTISDLSPKLLGETLSMVPMTSLGAVRCTCKKWNALSKHAIVYKGRNQFLGFMMMDSRVCSMRFDLQGIRNNGEEDLVDVSIKQIRKLDQIEVSKVLYCDGLSLCVIKDNSRLLVWNPYLGQTRWIQPRSSFHRLDKYALGYDSNNHHHKILRVLDDYDLHRQHLFGYEIYDFISDSWRVLDVTPDWEILYHQRGVSLYGNSYFFAHDKIIMTMTEGGDEDADEDDFLLCFDFTTEKFGPRLPLPFHSVPLETVTMSCVRDEQLAVLYQRLELCEILDIWVTTKIGPTEVSWTNFLKVDMRPLTGFQFDEEAATFFIDEEKKVAVVFDLDGFKPRASGANRYQTAYIIGQDGYFKSATLREAPDLGKPDKLYNPYEYCRPLVSSSYAPSLVQL